MDQSRGNPHGGGGVWPRQASIYTARAAYDPLTTRSEGGAMVCDDRGDGQTIPVVVKHAGVGAEPSTTKHRRRQRAALDARKLVKIFGDTWVAGRIPGPN